MGIGGEGIGGRAPQWIFTHRTANVFFTKHSFRKNIPTLINYRSSLLRWLTLRGRDD